MENITSRDLGVMLTKMSAEYADLVNTIIIDDKDTPLTARELERLYNAVMDIGSRNRRISALIGRVLRIAHVQQR